VASGLCLSELTLPIAEEPHFMLFAAAVALAPIRAGPLMAFAALYFVPIEYTAEAFTSGWRIVAAYPRLYAAWLLWTVTILEMWRLSRADSKRSGCGESWLDG
jgi:hypothetical protein